MHSRLSPTLLLSLTLGLLLPLQASALVSIRDQEIKECRPGEIATWGDGRDRPAVAAKLVFVYEHRGAPAWISEVLVMQLLERAVQAWAPCGVPAVVLRGAMTPALMAANPGNIQVLWDEAAARGSFALANLTQRQLAISPAGFALLKQRNPRHPFQETLQMVISHEMGHLYGLMAHSRRCVDVTSYYDNGRGETCYARDRSQLKSVTEYRSMLPTACDLQRCRAANGKNGKAGP